MLHFLKKNQPLHEKILDPPLGKKADKRFFQDGMPFIFCKIKYENFVNYF